MKTLPATQLVDAGSVFIVNTQNKSSIRTSFCTILECNPGLTPKVVMNVVRRVFRVFVSSWNTYKLFSEKNG